MKNGTFWLRYRRPSDSGKYIGFGLRIETGAERITTVDIFDIIQNVRDIGIHLKVDEQPKTSRGPQQRSERQVGREHTYTCYNTITRLLHYTNSKLGNKSLAKG